LQIVSGRGGAKPSGPGLSPEKTLFSPYQNVPEFHSLSEPVGFPDHFCGRGL
jgi:hypothetical protein